MVFLAVEHLLRPLVNSYVPRVINSRAIEIVCLLSQLLYTFDGVASHLRKDTSLFRRMQQREPKLVSVPL